MFVISLGMPKSGSTLFSWYQKELLGIGYRVNGQQEFERMIASGEIPGKGHFTDALETREQLQHLFLLSERAGPFVVKTHIRLNAPLRESISEGKAIATYIHRDPRDVILSAMDHGKRVLNNSSGNAYFVRFDSIVNSIPIVREFCETGLIWINSGLVNVFRYYDVIVNPVEELLKFCKLINIQTDITEVQRVIRKYSANVETGTRQFNTGRPLRFVDEMSSQDIAKCNSELYEQIIELGYMA